MIWPARVLTCKKYKVYRLFFGTQQQTFSGEYINLEAFAVIEFNVMLSGRHPRQDVKVFRLFRYWFRPSLQGADLTLYISCIIFQCVGKPTRCNTSYEWSLLFIIWLYMFRTITSPSSGASSHRLYNELVCSCRRV